jgi:hypothetical protein
MKRKALIQSEESEEFESAKGQAGSTFIIDPKVQRLRDEHGFVSKIGVKGKTFFRMGLLRCSM